MFRPQGVKEDTAIQYWGLIIAVLPFFIYGNGSTKPYSMHARLCLVISVDVMLMGLGFA